ncbi:MAG: response regulator receiver protein [Deltaproteobacteria bacterium SG8_13]|nr:MAG: response regulator receiver protein [Deltaproteobacteria bacterium SG8_13]
MNNDLLIVDDEKGIRKMLEITLADRGFSVHSAENGKQALQVFRKVRPSIVLTDIKMPDMDGIELLRRIKKEDKDVEVIMFTGQGDMGLAIQSLKNDATDFVTKPIDDEVLGIAIRRARERISMRRQIREYTENLEKLVDEKTRQLLEAERMAAIGETIAGLSHTIKNIAGGLRGGIFVLGQGIEQDDKQSLMDGWEMIQGNVDKIRRLSMDLLSYGKYAELHYRMEDPNLPAREVADLLQEQCRGAGITLQVKLSSRLERFYFDPEAIHRCLLNLVTNSVDACSAEGDDRKEKFITMESLPADGWGVEYRVQDTGIGMGEETLKRIFQSFFSTKGTMGSGIGLMMSKKIVDRHGGQIEVSSQTAVGTTFIIRLPRKTELDEEAAAEGRQTGSRRISKG